jgi:hypothetical protein
MTQNAIQKVLESKYKTGKVLSIKTNIATGYGINGVDYNSYQVGLLEKKKSDCYTASYVETSTQIEIVEFDDDFIVLKIITCNYKCYNSRVNLTSKSTNILYLPLDNIVSLCYMSPYDNNYYRLSEVR